MCNVTIAKNKLQSLTQRTEKDLYALKYESQILMSLNDDTFYKVKMVCNDNNLSCPLYKYSGEVKFRQIDNLFPILHTLANEYDIYLDYTKIPH